MKIETVQMIRDLINSGKGWNISDIVMVMLTHEGMSNSKDTWIKARQLEDIIIRFNNAEHHKYFEYQYFNRWLRMNNLIMSKAVNGLLVTQAERTHCNDSLMQAELYTY